MARTSPLHPRTAPLCTSFRWKEWNGFAAVCAYDGHSEREYFALRQSAGLLDISPLRKLDVLGPDAARLLSRVATRDIERLGQGRVTYTALTDAEGDCLDDCTVAHLGPAHFRLTSAEPLLHWLHRFARGLDVRITDRTEDLAALALQGPRSRAILAEVVDLDPSRMHFFRVSACRIAGCEGWVSRTGYTGDLGYELWFAPADALRIWDAVMAAGAPHDLTPVGLDALDVARIEAGFVLGGHDYVSARSALIPSDRSSPDAAGLGFTVELERATPFVGQAAVEVERRRGSERALVGMELSWPDLEALYEDYGLAPHLAPVACRQPVPIYAEDGRTQVGQLTSSTWSPLLKRYLGLGQVRASYRHTGTPLRVEHTVSYERRQLPAAVVPRPFFDPPRKRRTPEARAVREAS